MVGSAIRRKLEAAGYTQLVGRSSQDLDLRQQQAVADFFAAEKPEYVILAAAKVGGIVANNTYRADFIYDNLMIASNVIHQSHFHGVKKLLFLGSTCIYPKLAQQPMQESLLLSGYLEPTNQPYAIAKIAGIELCESYRAQHGCSFISAMPTNLYGPNDQYHLENSHVLPALLRKFTEAKAGNHPEVVLWGSGLPLREFLHVDDLAEACLHLMKHYDEPGLINIGSGEEISIRDLAELVREITDYSGNIRWDGSRSDGTPRKLLDSSKMHAMGWRAKISLRQGIQQLHEGFAANPAPFAAFA